MRPQSGMLNIGYSEAPVNETGFSSNTNHCKIPVYPAGGCCYRNSVKPCKSMPARAWQTAQ